MAQRLDFIDISRYQGTINFVLVKEAGVLGVIAKATENTTYQDPNYKTNRDGALNAGLAFASYHFLKPGNGGKQMEWYVKTACPREGERVVIDYEDINLTISDLYDCVDWLKFNRPDLQVSVYGANMLAEDVNAQSDVGWLEQTSLWAARYSQNEPMVGQAWMTWSAWQYSDEGQVDGISGPVDMNMFNGEREQCLAWFGPVEEIPIPMPLPKPLPEPLPEPLVTTVKGYGHEVNVMIDPLGGITVWVDGVEEYIS